MSFADNKLEPVAPKPETPEEMLVGGRLGACSAAQVFGVVEGELRYQDAKFNDATTTTGGRHTVTEFILYMEHELLKARNAASSQASPMADLEGLDFIRKVTALGVKAMMQNGIVPRARDAIADLTRT